jgi:D-amino-acid dehydrogenase
MTRQTKNVVIVGGGVIGLSIAYYAQKRGMGVTVLDRSPPETEGCSFGNAGMIVPSHFVPLAAPGMMALGLKWMWNPESPFYVKPRLDWDLLKWGWRFWAASSAARAAAAAPILRDLHLASRAEYEKLTADLKNEFELVTRGLAMLCKTQKGLDEEVHLAETANKLGVPAEVMDRDALSKLDPDITMDVAGGVYFPNDCHLSPNRLMAALRKAISDQGGRIIFSSEVKQWARVGRRIAAIETANGEYSGHEFILAAGAWANITARELGLSIPLQAGKGYSLTLMAPRELPRICSILTEARIAVTPMGRTLRFGGTMEMSGLHERIDPRRVRGIVKSVPFYFPRFEGSDFEGLTPWQGLRPCSPDGLPYIGRTKRYDNLTIAAGHAMMGLSLAPVTAKLVSQILASETPEIHLKLLDVDRFG